MHPSSEASSDTDEVARLFPKCRGRHDGHSQDDDDEADSLNNNHHPMEDGSVVSAYDTPSRIEIAGGREIFCKSRSRPKRRQRDAGEAWEDEPLVYEAPVCGAEVYDDIDERTNAPARLIGNVPIAQYEGSPRRYGPRPGYPQRVAADAQEADENTVCGSSYVGQRLAGATPSPRTPPSPRPPSPRLGGTPAAASPDPGSPGGGSPRRLSPRPRSNSSTETGEQMDEQTRNLTLSPDGTDCESASEAMSLAGSADAPLAMPVLEDGLSSGHLSDTEGSVGGGTQPPSDDVVSDAIREIQQAIQHSKRLALKSCGPAERGDAPPVWVPRLSQSTREDQAPDDDCDTDQETDRLLGAQRSDDRGFFDDKAQNSVGKKKNTSKEVLVHEPAVLIEGVLFRARYLGSTQLVCEGQPTKATRMIQAEEAVSRIKAPEGEAQPSTEVDLFISTEKIMVLNTDLKEIMMDHALRSISYIADIGDLVVLMARRRTLEDDAGGGSKLRRTPKMVCHVFESEEAQFIAQSIGQAFQVAYMEFLKANGIEDSSFVKEMDYQEVLNSQEIFGNELEMFAKKERQKEVVVPKHKGEILGMVIVESGWGSMLPTVVVANMAHNGPAARCSQLNIGDQIIAINGVSLVGLPLSTCQAYVKNTKHQSVVKLTVVPCAPVVEVKIKRPDTKYQLGFSVQNGVICSLLRGGIAERGGVRVGHRIIEINGQSVVAVPHEKIVNLLATSVGEIHMKTMPTSMFRLLTGQETPMYI
ncbi:protein lin-10 isoform X1 [Dermacentor silvarum]|uniref:protein lin-10 isoform X1 n=1 Tax=Dermacentor silvarum TaxID=543639 RepID=UPI00189B6926|nr:protein lin-10 isoform X1 [Dermacentor silvarum]